MVILKSVVVMILCMTLGSHFGRYHFVLDLFTQFKAHYLALLLFSAVLFLYFKQSTWIAVSLLGAIVNSFAIIPWYIADENLRETAANSIRILISNVAMNRINHQKLEQLIEEGQPDLVGLVEVSPQLLEDLDARLDGYGFRFEHPTTESNHGLALFSKYPIIDASVVFFGEKATATIVANIEAGGHAVEIILTHPYWPLGADRGERRNTQLQEIADYVRQSDNTVIVAGDLNTTMWSPHYKEFVNASGLSNARQGYGIGASFPSRLPLLGIPIDHILITGPSRLRDFQVNTSVGSDHLPISAEAILITRQPF